MKLWEKNLPLSKTAEAFTVGDDYLLDQRLIIHDCIASKAHAAMLESMGIMKTDELAAVEKCLDEIIDLSEKGEFSILPDQEDCHTAIENYLTEHCGPAGQKIHTGRSRNDQVLTALRLFEKAALNDLQESLNSFIESLKGLDERQGKTRMPGYTHTQRAMPTTVHTWAHCFVDAAKDNLRSLGSALEIIDQSPLGTAAGFGVPGLDLDRPMTAAALGFARIMENPMYAQLSRGKFEWLIGGVCSQIMFDLNRLACDLILFNTREFGFICLDETVCTGSSIMPQKKNPDVLELVRAKYHVVLGEEMKLKSLTSNLTLGYHRDLQLTKAAVFVCIDTALACLAISKEVVDTMRFDSVACEAALSDELFATERAYELVNQGVPFRKAYNMIAENLFRLTQKDES